MNKLMLLTGVDVPLPTLGLTIHQPRIKEVSYVGELTYFSTLQLLCFDKNTIMAGDSQGALSLFNMSEFQIFMTLINTPKEEERIKVQNNFINVFTLLFPGYELQFLPNGLGLYLNNSTTKHSLVINDNNFDEFKQAIMEITAIRNNVGGENSNFNPRGKKAAQIAAKIMRGRSKAAADKGYKADGVLGRYISILTVGLPSMSLNDCLDLTTYQLYDLIERFGLYIGWDLDIKSRLAGATPDDKPEDWMKDIH